MVVIDWNYSGLDKNYDSKIAYARDNANYRACRLIDGKPCSCSNVCFMTDGGCPCNSEDYSTHPIVIVERGQ